MIILDADAPIFKKWVIKKLEDISDADSDVLAEYVLALIRSEESDEEVRNNCVENLKDFLREDSEKFVTEVFEAVKAKSYVPGYVAPSTLLATAPSFTPSFNPPSGPSSLANTRPHASGIVNGANGGGFQSKKRTYHEHVGNENHEPYVPGGGFERSTKQMRRGGRGEQRGGNAQMPSFPGNPLMNPAGLNLFNAPGIPALDPTNPMSAFLAFQAMNSVLGLPPVPMPGVQSPVQSTFGAQGGTSQRRGKRCFDYDSKGFCARGGSCPYDHGIDYINNVVGANSQPIHTLPNPSLTGIFPINDGGLPLYNSSSSGNQEQQNRSGRGGRAPFSAVGRNMDRSITTIVVESIPEENFTEEAVKEYFSQFGNITEVTMQPYKRLALVKFDDYWAARNAYESPKTIFDNRFVKVYWYKPTGKTNTGAPAKPDGDTKPSPAPSSGRPDTEMTDPVEIEKKLADAQKAHEEKQRKLEEARTQKADLDEQMRKQAEERKKLLDAIAAKEKKKGGQGESTIEAKNKNDAFDALKAKVAMLEAEAESLGFDPNESNDELQAKVAMLKAEAESLRRDPNDAYNNAEEQGSYGYRGRGRGGYRGRGRFFSRARGAGRGNFGGYRGRGAPFGGAPPGGGGTVMRLDNRPKKVRVGIGPGSPQDEALRQYLFNGFEFDSIAPHPERSDAQVVSFKERYLAESFIYGAPETLGRIELGWFTDGLPNPAKEKAPPTSNGKPAPVEVKAVDVNTASKEGDVQMNDSVTEPQKEGGAVAPVAPVAPVLEPQQDLDVADDEDRWVG